MNENWFNDCELLLFLTNDPKWRMDKLVWYEYDGYILSCPYRFNPDDGFYHWTEHKIAFYDMNELEYYLDKLRNIGNGRNVELIHSDDWE